MFITDILAGILLIVAAVLLIIASVGYKRYRIKGMIFAIVAFFIFFIKALIYELNTLLTLNIDFMEISLLLDITILITMYFALALKR